MSNLIQQRHSICSFTSSDSWAILSPIEQNIKRKIEAVGTPLENWDIQINYGIKTGCNEAFIISTQEREDILSNCKDREERLRTAELIRPILRGRDINRYGYNWANLWLINTHNGIRGRLERIHIEDYPAIKAHLDQYWNRISKRADKGDTPYNLRNCAYLDNFSLPKIIWKRIGSILRFSYDNTGYLGLDSTCFATGEYIEYLCCVLNSLMGHYLLKDSPKTGTGDLLVSVQAIEPVRVPYYAKYDSKLSNLLDRQITNCTIGVEKEINDIVFSMYGLSPNEQEYVTLYVKQSQQSQ
ncbi:MAG: class I SAM-dependent DNA methyltransferase [Prevotella sp.]|nr:class I SAM-dependent DNA methyltransferase [Prevotella sp.]MCH4211699.1 class I SAM-dependent DNA methyltransferase [Prevotella sp.]